MLVLKNNNEDRLKFKKFQWVKKMYFILKLF